VLSNYVLLEKRCWFDILEPPFFIAHLSYEVLRMCIMYNSFLSVMLQEVEADVKARTKGEMGAAKTLCSPFDQPELPEGIILCLCRCYYFLMQQNLKTICRL